MDARQRFRDLGRVVERLAGELCRSTKDTQEAPPGHDKSLQGDSSLEVQTQSLVIDESRSGGSRPSIVIPGLTPVGPSPLVTPMVVDLEESEAQAPERADTATKVVDKKAEELVAALEAPLVALGLIEAQALVAVVERVDWARWWIEAPARGADQEMIALRYIGPWFGRTVVAGQAASLIIGGDILPKDTYKRVVARYFGSDSGLLGETASWWSVAAVSAVLGASAGAADTATLTLALRLLEQAVKQGQLDPQRAIARPRAEWAEYLRLVGALPDRVANKVDPDSIPLELQPQSFFARLARLSTAPANAWAESQLEMVTELWAKLCAVGQTPALCVELASALLVAAHERLDGADESEVLEDRLSALARVMVAVPPPLHERLVTGVVSQLDTVGSEYFAGSDSVVFPRQLTLVLCTLLTAAQPGSDIVDAARALLVWRGSSADGLWSVGMSQSLVLALQLLSGQSGLDASLARCAVLVSPQPDVILDTLMRAVVPLWSSPQTMARVEEVKALTALLMMCVAGLTREQSVALSMSAEFTRAMPRFLDAPLPVVRLSGIIVADCVISRTEMQATDVGKIDFGLDDIIDEAQSPERSSEETRAGAKYIRRMRKYARPIKEQWTDHMAESDDNTAVSESSTPKTLEGAANYLREYNGQDVVLAPRQSSLTRDPELQSGYVRPRKPVFLRDCLAYLRDRNSNESRGEERVEIALFALAECVERASVRALEEMWVPVANRLLHLHNRGADYLDARWDQERRNVLSSLAVHLPRAVGPYLADRACDRNLTAADRQLVLSVISTACLRLSGISTEDESKAPGIVDITDREGQRDRMDKVAAGTVVRRSRRLDILKAAEQKNKGVVTSGGELVERAQREYAALVGPSFFTPLVAQYAKSDIASVFDVRQDAGELARYLNTLGVILYSSASATHQLSMNRDFWDLTRLVRRQLPPDVAESPPVVDAMLFGVDVVLSPERALSTPTLAREFRADITDALAWINLLVSRDVLADDSAKASAARVVRRLQELQGEVYRRVTSGDIHEYTSII